jgi:hypothetical protein
MEVSDEIKVRRVLGERADSVFQIKATRFPQSVSCLALLTANEAAPSSGCPHVRIYILIAYLHRLQALFRHGCLRDTQHDSDNDHSNTLRQDPQNRPKRKRCRKRKARQNQSKEWQ